MKKTFVAILLGWLIAASSIWAEQSPSQSKITPPVDTDMSIDRSAFQADFEQVWQTLLDLLTEYGFKFQIRDKSQGQAGNGLCRLFT